MYIVDITTAANYFGRVTGITRVEKEVASQFVRAHPEATHFVYWCNDKNSFELYQGGLEFRNIKAAKLSRDLSVSYNSFAATAGDELDMSDGGSLIVTGSGWLQNKNYALGCISFAKAHGLSLMFYIHDLIPIKFPYYYDEKYVRKFTESLTLIASSGALLVCNSENTRKDLLSWCGQNDLPARQTAIAYLGDRFSVSETESDTQATDAQQGHELDGNYVLTVGAIHRRKNYALLAAVWRRLQARMGGRCPKLKIVGGVTPDGKPLHQEISSDPLLKDVIEVLYDVNDAQLEQLYQNARLVVYPSHYEGWGLPVSEALGFGKICLASNVSAIPEIADLGSDFLEPDDPVSWASRIMFYCQNQQQREAREAELEAIYAPRTWEETVEQITASLDGYTLPEVPALYPGDQVRFDEELSERFLASRCYPVENWGRWCAGGVLKIRFALAAHDHGALTAALKLNLHSDATGRVVINGHLLTTKRLRAGIHTYWVEIPDGLLEGENRLEVQVDSVVALSKSEKKEHARPHTALGIAELGLWSQDQIEYDLLDSGGEVRALRRIDLNAKKTFGLLCGLRHEDGVHARNGLVSVLLKKSQPNLGTTKAAAYFKLPRYQDAFLTVRVNGKIVTQKELAPDILGNAGVMFDLNSGTSDLRDIEFFFVSSDTNKKLDFVLTELLLPEVFCEDPAVFELGQQVSLSDYLIFGQDAENTSSGTLQAGWNEKEWFGVSCQTAGALALQIGAGGEVGKVKLNCKLVSEGVENVLFWVNGDTFERSVGSEVKPQLFELSEPLLAGDRLDIQVFAQGQGRFVLRHLQLLPM